jgi:hypothetical protein
MLHDHATVIINLIRVREAGSWLELKREFAVEDQESKCFAMEWSLYASFMYTSLSYLSESDRSLQLRIDLESPRLDDLSQHLPLLGREVVQAPVIACEILR